MSAISKVALSNVVVAAILAICLLPLGPAIGQQRQVQVFNTESSAEPTTFENTPTILENSADAQTAAVLAVAHSPTGSVIASSHEDGTVQLRDAATGNELHVFKGHKDVVANVAFSPDGKTLATASYDKSIKLWDVASGKELTKFSGHTNWIFSAAFSPDGKLLVSGSYDKTVRLWDIASSKEIAKLEGHTATVRSVVFSPDGKQIASGSGDRTVRFWDVKTRSEIVKLSGHKGSIRAIAFSPDGKTIASASEDNTIKIWDVASKTERRELAGHTDMVWTLAFSPRGKTLASGSFDNSIRIWDVETGQSRQRLTGHSDVVTSLAFAADMSGLVSGSYDKSLRLWKSKQPPVSELVTLAVTPQGLRVSSFSPDGRWLLTASHDAIAKIWDLSNAKVAVTLRGHSGGIRTGAWSSNGRRVATGGWDHSIRIWNAESGEMIGTLVDGQHDVMTVEFTPDGKKLVSGGRDKTAKVWDLDSQKVLLTTPAHTGPLVGADISPDGKTFVTATGDYKNSSAVGEVKLFDVETGKLIREFKGHTKGVISARFSPDGKQILTTSYDESRLWDVATGNQLRTLGTSGSSAASFFADGKTVAIARYKALGIWDVETGKQIRTYTGHPGTTYKLDLSPDETAMVTAGQDGAAKFWPTGRLSDGTSLDTASHIRTIWPGTRSVPRLISGSKKDVQDGTVHRTSASPDFKLLALCGDSKTVQIVETATGNHVRMIAGHADTIRDCVFSPDGLLIATAAKNNVRLIHVENGGTVASMSDHERDVVSVLFTPNGKTLITGDEGGTIKLWDAKNRQQLGSMTRREKSELTCMAISPDGKLLAAGDTSKSVTLWDLASRSRITTFTRHKDRVTAMAFSPDSRTLVTGAFSEAGDTSVLMVWDVPTRALRPSYQVSMKGITAVSFSSDGNTFATTAADRLIRLWDTNTSHLLATILSGHEADVGDLLWSADGKQLVSASTDGVVSTWDIGETGASWIGGYSAVSRDELTATFRKTIVNHGKIARVAFFSRDRRLIATGGSESQLKIWNAKSLELTQSIDTSENDITSAAFTSDAKLIATGGTSETVRVFDVATGEKMLELEEPNSTIRKVIISPDDADLIVCANEDGNLYIWDIATGKIKKTIPAGMHVYSVAVSPDGKMLATGSLRWSEKKFGPITLWDYETGRKLKELRGSEGNLLGLAFLEDSRQIVAANAGQVGVTVWDITSGRMLRSMHRRPDVHALRLRQGTNHFATAHGNGPGMAGLWDAETGRRLCYFKAHGPVIWMTEISPDGKTMITAGADGDVKAWTISEQSNR